jgi:Flp pilus assembly protein TadG
MPRFVARTLSIARDTVRNFRHSDDGSILAYMVVIPVLAGVLAIGVETGELYRVKRQMQGAADAAAIVGATDYAAGASVSKATATARQEAKRNGFADGSGGVTVVVNVPQISGPQIGGVNAVEVVISKTQNLSFGAVLNSWMGRPSNGYLLMSRGVALPSTSARPERN